MDEQRRLLENNLKRCQFFISSGDKVEFEIRRLLMMMTTMTQMIMTMDSGHWPGSWTWRRSWAASRERQRSQTGSSMTSLRWTDFDDVSNEDGQDGLKSLLWLSWGGGLVECPGGPIESKRLRKGRKWSCTIVHQVVVPDFTAKSAELRGDLYRACLAQADPGGVIKLWGFKGQAIQFFSAN